MFPSLLLIKNDLTALHKRSSSCSFEPNAQRFMLIETKTNISLKCIASEKGGGALLLRDRRLQSSSILREKTSQVFIERNEKEYISIHKYLTELTGKSLLLLQSVVVNNTLKFVTTIII